MLIVCPNCTSSYAVADDKLGPAGRSVRCLRCRTVWFAGAAEPEPIDDLAMLPHTEPAEPSQAPAAPDAAGAADEAPEGGAYSWTFSLEEEEGEAAEQPPAPPVHEVEVVPIITPVEPAFVADAPALAPVLDEAASATPAPDASRPADVETLAARRTKARAKRRRRAQVPMLPLAIVGLCAVVAALLVWRREVVRFAPQTASLYASLGMPVNLRGLAF